MAVYPITCPCPWLCTYKMFFRDHLGMVGDVDYGQQEGVVVNGSRASIQRPRFSFFKVAKLLLWLWSKWGIFFEMLTDTACFRDHLAMVGEIQYKKNAEEPALQVDRNWMALPFCLMVLNNCLLVSDLFVNSAYKTAQSHKSEGFVEKNCRIKLSFLYNKTKSSISTDLFLTGERRKANESKA